MTTSHAPHSAKRGSVPATRLLQVPQPSIPDDIIFAQAPLVPRELLITVFIKSFTSLETKIGKKKNPYLWSGLNRVSVGGNKVFKDESISFNSSANCVKP